MSNYFWCDVNLKNIENNINVIRDLIQNKKLIAVIKGDAYGLGSKSLITLDRKSTRLNSSH